MQLRAFAPALGALAAILVAAGVPSYAFAADPSGIWAKEDGSAKMEVKKCGRGICSKIVWLKNPEDSRGRPLRDARNENTSMRDRPIIGLPLFANMVAIDSSTWQGSVYNPEEGTIYTVVQVTLASRNQIVLKGCKAWLLCGEKYWTRSKLPPTEAEPEPIEVKAPAEPVEPADQAAPDGQKPIEVKATQPPPMDMAPKAPMDMASKVPMDMAPRSKPEPAPIVEAKREPIAEPPAPKPIAEPLAAEPSSEATTVEARVSVAPPKQRTASPAASQRAVGLGLVTTPTSHPDPLPLTGEDVSSMMVMTKRAPVAATPAPATPAPEVSEANVESAAVDNEPPAPPPAAKPKPKTLSADASESASEAGEPRVVAVKPMPKVKPKEPEEVLPWLRPRY